MNLLIKKYLLRVYFALIMLCLGILNSCTSSKSTPVKMKQISGVSCDVNTKICNSSSSTNDLTLSTSIPKKQTIVLNYYYDALCGWCYGFSPVIQKLQSQYQDKIKINVISGGLFSGNHVGRVNDVAPHIKSGAYRSVEVLTSVKFGEKFLADVFAEGNMVLNSIPPTKALSIVRDYYPEKELDFAADLLKAVYFDGIHPEQVEAYIPYIENIGMDKALFLKEMHSTAYDNKVVEEINQFRQSPNSGMPAIAVLDNGVEIPIAKGYVNFEELESRLSNFLK